MADLLSDQVYFSLIFLIFQYSVVFNSEVVSPSCPSSCTCPSLRALVTCRVENPEAKPLECGVLWHHLRLDLKTAKLQTNFFVICQHVRHLTFTARSRLRDLSETTFIGLKELRTFNADHSGNLQNLGPNFLSATHFLESFRIYRNQISRLTAAALKPCANLSSFDLTGNDINIIDDESFSHCRHLQFIRLGGNKINHLRRQTFKGLRRLEHLSLNANQINNISNDSFHDLEHLLQLDLSTNNIYKLIARSFAGLQRLEVLDLSDNSISFLDKSVFSDLVKLKVLKLYGNRLGPMDWQLFLSNNKLAKLQLSTDINDRHQVFCVIESPKTAPKFALPNQSVRVVFRQFVLCNGAKRLPDDIVDRWTTTPKKMNPTQSIQIEYQSPKSNEQVPFLYKHPTGMVPSDSEDKNWNKVSLEQPPQRRPVDKKFHMVWRIPSWVVWLVCLLSIAFLSSLGGLVLFCLVQQRERVPLPNTTSQHSLVMKDSIHHPVGVHINAANQLHSADTESLYPNFMEQESSDQDLVMQTSHQQLDNDRQLQNSNVAINKSSTMLSNRDNCQQCRLPKQRLRQYDMIAHYSATNSGNVLRNSYIDSGFLSHNCTDQTRCPFITDHLVEHSVIENRNSPCTSIQISHNMDSVLTTTI